jgi:hypothetical protein
MRRVVCCLTYVAQLLACAQEILLADDTRALLGGGRGLQDS